jgi:hypothetical protein
MDSLKNIPQILEINKPVLVDVMFSRCINMKYTITLKFKILKSARE